MKDARGVTPAMIGAGNGMSRDNFLHLTRSDARRDGHLQDKLDALESAVQEGDYSGVKDVAALRGALDAGLDANWEMNAEFGDTLLHFTARYGDPHNAPPSRTLPFSTRSFSASSPRS